MDEFSQMTHISKLDLQEFDPEMSFSITLDKFQPKNNNDENQSIDLISNHLKTQLKQDISDSVMNLTQCFICLSIANNPLSCPNCNNFACKDCLETYFGKQTCKVCPLCKKAIYKKDLRKNKTIRDIEKIIYKEDTKINKIEELTRFINDKKQIWENQEQYINNLIDKVVKYQENLREYRKKYEKYFLSWKEKINEMFGLYEKKVEDLINLLTQYRQKYGNDLSISIKKYNAIKEKNKFSKTDINTLVNEILAMERRYFNEEKKKHEQDKNDDDDDANLIVKKNQKSFFFDELIKKSNAFFITPILVMPNISNYTIETIYLGKKDLKKNYSKKDYNVHVGYYQVQYLFDKENYKALCKLYIKKDKNVSFFPVQKKVIASKIYEIYPMKDISDLTHNIYETQINLNELKDYLKETIRIETKIQIFTVIG